MPVLSNGFKDTLEVNRDGESLFGTLKDKNKNGIGGAKIIFFEAVTATTDGDGEFGSTVEVEDGAEYGIQITKGPGKVHILSTFNSDDTLTGPAKEELVFSFSGGTVSGRLRNKEDQPISGATVIICNLKKNRFTATTGRLGKYSTNAEAEAGDAFFVEATISSGNTKRLLIGAFISD